MNIEQIGETQLLRRIDRASVIGDKGAILDIVISNKNQTHFLYRVGGIVIGQVSGTKKQADGKDTIWTKLIGRFRAINHKGNAFAAAAAFLPPDLTAVLLATMEKSDADQVYFFYDVYARYDATLATSYGYICEAVRDTTVEDPLDILFSGRMLSALKEQKLLSNAPGTND